jgi:hypothetical protein
MSPVLQEHVDQVRNLIREVLGDSGSDIFLQRLDAILSDWAKDKLTAAQACEKVQKSVSLFIDENKAREIGNRCAPIVMKESVVQKK